MKTLTLALSLVAASAAVDAQNGPLIGFMAQDGAVPTSSLDRQELCQPPVEFCQNALPAPTDSAAGGAAYDPRDRSLWHTQGTRIRQVFPDECRTGCEMAANLVLGATSVVGGLTLDPAHELLYAAESVPGTGIIGVYALGAAPAGGCPPATFLCQIALPTATHRIGAIALDRKREMMYVAASTFTPGDPQNRVLVFDMANPCNVLCYLSVGCDSPVGGLASIQAMAYEECRDLLYVSDGRSVSVSSVVWGSAPCPSLAPTGCCPVNSRSSMFWRGFDLEPSRSRTIGMSCTDATLCASCPAMSLRDIGDPVIGNPEYGFAIESAPSGSTGWVLMNFGPCQPVPFGCDRIFPALAPAPLVLGPVALGGVGACGGNGEFSLPLPNSFGMCSWQLCVQGIVLCPGFGIGLTNGLEVQIGS